ncbi:MAG: MFS transporter [Pseudomonadota bacterium]
MSRTPITLPPVLIARIFVPFALGYFTSYLYRVINSVIAGDLTQSIGIDAEQLGLLTSAYLIAFAAAQLPLGVFLDRFGPRTVEAALLMCAAAGAWIFASAETVTGLIIGRLLIGLGVSACLMAAFKSIVQWFPSDRIPLANGILLTSGGLGILSAAAPVEWALQFTDWRGVFQILAVFTSGVALTIFLLVPERNTEVPRQSLSAHLRAIAALFGTRRFWHLTPLSTACQGSAIATIGLWTGPWLRDVSAMNRADVALTITWLGASILAGFALMGWIADQLRKWGVSTMTTGSVGMALFLLAQIGLIMQWTQWSVFLWMAYGFLSTSGMLTYAVLSQSFDSAVAGRVNTCFNAMVFVFAFAAQWGLGAVIEHYSAGETFAGYAPEGYQVGFSLLWLIQLGCLIWYLVSVRREKELLVN